MRDLNLPGGVDEARFNRRKSLLETVDHHFRTLEKSDAIDSMDAFYQHAYKLISSQKAREAFDLKAEPDALKDEYGRTAAGQRMLLARRLIEAGVRFVSLTAGGWDHHDNIKAGIQKELPPIDKAIAALIRDLDRRGMLDSTLVMVTTEFGRSPEDQRHRRPRPLAARLLHHARRRRHETRLRPRRVRRPRRRGR